MAGLWMISPDDKVQIAENTRLTAELQLWIHTTIWMKNADTKIPLYIIYHKTYVTNTITAVFLFCVSW